MSDDYDDDKYGNSNGGYSVVYVHMLYIYHYMLMVVVMYLWWR